MRSWIVLISLLLNALFAPQFSFLCDCPYPLSPAPVDVSCPCCSAGECDCGIAPTTPSTLPAKDPLALPRLSEPLHATLESHPRVIWTLSRPAQVFSLALRSTGLPCASAREHRALLCQWQT